MEQETIKMEETRKQLSKSEVIGSFIGIGMVGFCFGIGLMLAVKTVNNLECCIKAENAYKMAEDNQVTKEPQGEPAQPPSGAQLVQQIMKEPQRVTTKNPKKVEAGKRLAESNRKKREAKKREEQAKFEASRVNQYYGIGAVIALGVIGGLDYYIYPTKKGQTGGEVKDSSTMRNPIVSQQPKANKFEID